MPAKNTAEMRQFVSFTVDDSLYGFDIRIVKEITPSINITPIPLRNKDVRGIVSIRGQVVLVFDIAVIINENEQEKNDDCQIVILKVSREIAAVPDYHPAFDIETIGNKPIGFVVDAIGDIVTVESSRIEAAPSHLDVQHSPYIEGIVHLPGKPLLILNAGKIIEKHK